MNNKSKLVFVTFLTLVRFPLVLLFFVGAVANSCRPQPLTWIFFASFFALVLAAVTDLFDGYYARKFNVTTELRAHADPLMDKIYYLTALPALVYIALRNGNTFHATLLLGITVLFLARDQWVSFLRAIGSRYNVSGCASFTGKLRTAVNFPLLCAIYYIEAVPKKYLFFCMDLIYTFEALAIVITLYSFYSYTRHYWPQLRQAARPEHSNH